MDTSLEEYSACSDDHLIADDLRTEDVDRQVWGRQDWVFPPPRLQATSREFPDSETESLRVVVEIGLERNIVIFDPHPLHSDLTRVLIDKQGEFQSALPHEGVQRVL